MGAFALAAAPLAVAGWAGAAPGNPQGGTYQTACDSAVGDSVVTWTPTNLWPPNHKPRTISITLTDPDGTGAVMHSIDVGTVAEFPAGENGAGNTAQDWSNIKSGGSVADNVPATASVDVLSERSGHDMTGRTYAITVNCHDDNGATNSMAVLCVTVPHDQSAKHTPVEDPAANCAAETVPSP